MEGDVINPDPYMDIKYVKSYNWMAKIPGDRLITHINTPGTHDAGTSLMDGIFKPKHSQCQDLQIDKQLNAGVRFLDCRLGYYKGDLLLFHGDNKGIWGPIKECRCWVLDDDGIKKPLKMEKVLNWCINFVTENPTETVFMRLRHETRDSEECKIHTNEVLAKYKNTGRLYINEKLPMLSEVRGKVVVIDDGAGAEGALSLRKSKEEDHYGDNGLEKIIHLKQFLNDNCKTDIDKQNKEAYYLIHTSCCNEDHAKLPTPRKQAKIVNPWFIKECSLVKGRYYGTIAMDFVTQEMAEKVYMTNFK